MPPISNLSEQLRRDEGEKLQLYRDSLGKFTIGVGRNLSDVGISSDESGLMLANDIKHARFSLEVNFPWALELDEARQGVMLNMLFNIGARGLAGFTDFLAKARVNDFKGAAQSMLDSRWAQEVGKRAQRLSVQMESGVWQ